MKIYIIAGVILCISVVIFSINEVQKEKQSLADGWMY
jgi:hypothetical protein